MSNKPQTPESRNEGELDLVEVAITLVKRKRLILLAPIAAALIAAIVSLALPDIYKASTKILPPQQAQSGAAGLLSQLGGVAGIAASGMAGIKNPNDLYVAMLKSRSIADRLISTFDLAKVYELDSREKTRATLEERTTIAGGKDGLITVSVEDKDPARSARLANAYVKELFALTKVLAVTEAAQRRVFFERQLETVKNNLARAELDLKRSLSSRGVISVDAESRGLLETVSRLRAQVSAKEIQLNSTKAFITPGNPEYKRLQEELNSLRGELERLENGSAPQSLAAGDAGNPRDRFQGLENIKVLREVKYQQMLYEILAKQYEASRLDEAKEAPLIQVLDEAITPERKSRPVRSVLVIVAFLLTLVGTILFVLFSEARRRAMQIPERASKWNELKSSFR